MTLKEFLSRLCNLKIYDIFMCLVWIVSREMPENSIHTKTQTNIDCRDCVKVHNLMNKLDNIDCSKCVGSHTLIKQAKNKNKNS